MYIRNLKAELLTLCLTFISVVLLAVCLLNVAWNYLSEGIDTVIGSLATAIFIAASLLKSRQDEHELEYWRKLHNAQEQGVVRVDTIGRGSPKRSI